MPVKLPKFKDPELQAKFEEDGFVKISLLNDDQVERAYSFYLQYHVEPVSRKKYYNTYETQNGELIQGVDDFLKSILRPALDVQMEDYKEMSCSYMVKQPGPDSESPMHQDPSFVDETKFGSATVWVALQDMNHENGNLFFVKGTHKLMPSLRVYGCPRVYDDVKDLLYKHIIEVPVKKGEALVFNHAVAHGAPANNSQKLRLAAAMTIMPFDAEWVFYNKNNEKQGDNVDMYRVSVKNFYSHNLGQSPQNAELIGQIAWSFPKISAAEFEKRMKMQNRSNGFLQVVYRKLFGNRLKIHYT